MTIDFFKESLSNINITAIGGLFVFCFAVYKYIHSHQAMTRATKFEQFRNIIEWVSGKTANGVTLTITQQTAAIYQLSEFPEYKYISLPIIEHYLEDAPTRPESTLLRSALLFSKDKLS